MFIRMEIENKVLKQILHFFSFLDLRGLSFPMQSKDFNEKLLGTAFPIQISINVEQSALNPLTFPNYIFMSMIKCR